MPEETSTWVLTVEAVREAVSDLRSRRIHPFFPAYLHLRQRASLEGRPTDIRAQWKRGLGPFLEVAGAPPTHPYFRPFWEGADAAGQGWLNGNLAGSFAPSSLRAGQPPLRVLNVAAGSSTFSFREDHWELARTHLLDGQEVPVAFVAAWLFRDFGFEADGGPPSGDDLVRVFRSEFGYRVPEDDLEFETLFTLKPTADASWFEAAPDESSEEAG